LAQQQEINQLTDHLFRHEAGKLVTVLTRIFGFENLGLAEDVVQDSLAEAISQWAYKGIPQNPSAWLFRVAKNKALNIINREKYKHRYAAHIKSSFEEGDEPASLDELFTGQSIADDQLRMMFTCCHPAISPDSQVALTLKTLCGFSIPEIAKAFLADEENIHKRLVRARQKIRDNNLPFEVPPAAQLEERVDAVLETIYLLFNEGYSASKGDDIIRYELCEEAIRLAEIIAANPAIQNKCKVYALVALMLLNASRFASRKDSGGNILNMAEQDRTLWNRGLMQNGFYYLQKITGGCDISAYHILATISAFHCSAPDFESTDWQSILHLYDNLLQIDNSPVVLLNRAIAIAKASGPAMALEELEQIKDKPAMQSYYLFWSTEAEFYMQLNEFAKAKNCLEKAIQLAALPAEKGLLEKKLAECQKKLL
jgi:RNA polymerase sigma-70 factor (ECF subfamily)